MASPYTIGRNARIIFLWNGVPVDLRDVTSFQANPDSNTQRVDPLNGRPKEFNTPNGWRGSFQVARANSALDDLYNSVEQGFWNAGTINLGQLFAYVKEPDGSTSTWQFDDVSFTFSTDPYVGEGVVHQSMNFFASQRTKVQ